ncbi:MAG TPA: hypothetical protein PL155_03185 [Candidatus Omnitrophota bacterium]|nr:hypothetical protein [Candidatus Omnitrophota bacterium]HPD84515.1 hypothetical protein [Candidatus Omnitrophota bacterium]HRZ03373.1 hypothetical protein [Candidatus Omnitrophota bacterium]
MHKGYQENSKAQATIEYMLLFVMVAVIVFFGFKNLLPKATVSSGAYFNQASGAIMGDPPPLFPAVGTKIVPANCEWTGQWDEDQESSGGVWNYYCYQRNPSRPFLCGRAHYGDQDDPTQHYCCGSSPNRTAADLINITELVCDDESECGTRICPSNSPFMVGRRHRGDENDKTVYACAGANDASGAPFCMNGPQNNCTWEGGNSESDEGGWGDPHRCPDARPFLHGRYHWPHDVDGCGQDNGDENACTQYLCCNAISYPEYNNCVGLIACADRSFVDCCGDELCSTSYEWERRGGFGGYHWTAVYQGCIDRPAGYGECRYETHPPCSTVNEDECCDVGDYCSRSYIVHPPVEYLGCIDRPAGEGCNIYDVSALACDDRLTEAWCCADGNCHWEHGMWGNPGHCETPSPANPACNE